MNKDVSHAGLSCTLAADARAIDGVCDLAERFCAASSLTPHASTSLALVLEELVANCLDHGDVQGEDAIVVSLQPDGAGVLISLSDNGQPFDPNSNLSRDTRFDDVDDRPVGGLGWVLIGHYCTLLDAQRVAERNQLSLRFNADATTLARADAERPQD
jgi:serine/threonine-protein kinase RsbW